MDLKMITLVKKQLKHNLMSSVIWEINALYEPNTTRNKPM